MIPIELKPLLMRLNRAASRALEAAAGLCVSRSQYEVTVEHVLLKMLDAPDSDVAFIVLHFDIEAPRLARSIEQALTTQKTGNAGKPVLSPLLIEWIEDAWMVASIEQSENAIRTGSLLTALASRPHRYLTSDLPELEKLRADDLKRGFRDIVAGSPEEGQRALEAPGGGGAAGPRRADSALGKFANNLTAAARAGRIDPVFARDAEIRQAIDILLRRRKNNPIIVGEAGVGKTAIVEGLALRMAEGDVPDVLRGVDIYGLDLGLLQAGAGVRGEFEARLKAVIDEVKASAKSIILFIDEAHTLIGAGNAPGASDAANLLKPALARGEVRTIAATTWAEYKKYIEEDAALARRFQPIKVDEPSAEDAALMLRGLKEKYEAAHGITIRDDAIDAAARLSARYIAGRLLPDKAVDLIDTAAARVRVGQSGKPASVEDLERRISALQREQEGLTRDRAGGEPIDEARLERLSAALDKANLEHADLTARWKAQQDAVRRVQELRKKPIQDAATRAEIEAALSSLRALQGTSPLVRLEVDPDVVAHVVGDWTGVPVGKMLEDEASKALHLEARLKERIKGQDQAVEMVSRALRAAKVGLKDPKKPQVFLLVGPSGVGKTELGLTVADMLFGGERFAVSINMSEYQDREMGVSGLLGAKPGYVGYGKGGTLTEAVRQRPYSVVLLDEIEKSCTEVRNLFYQVFDKGELTDGTGRKIDFKNTVIFLTTNLTAEVIEGATRDDSPPAANVVDLIRPTLSHALQPAWLARTTIVPFYSLKRAAIAEIAALKLAKLSSRMAETHRVELVIPQAVVDRIADRCTEVETGARNIDFILEGTLLPLMSTEILKRLSEGALSPQPSQMAIGLDASGELTAAFVAVDAALQAPARQSP